MDEQRIVQLFNQLMERARTEGRFIQTNASQIANDEQIEAIAESVAKETGEKPEHILSIIKHSREIALPEVESKSSIIQIGFGNQIITPPWFRRD